VDLLGRRHALICVLELRSGSLPFRTLAQRAAAPENVISQRLRELREAGLVEVDEAGDYRLTAEGRRLQGPLESLLSYAEHWASLSPRQRVPRGAASHGAGERDA
jgi:DNA-binding HxlR family transcriptional regulator